MVLRPPRPARVAFVTALVAGLTMIAASVHGMLGIDRQLQRSAQAMTPHSAPAFETVHVRGVYCEHPAHRV